jgi:hypothetical protein
LRKKIGAVQLEVCIEKCQFKFLIYKELPKKTTFLLLQLKGDTVASFFGE